MIRNEFAVTREMYLDWCRESQKKGIAGKFRVSWALLAVVMFIMGAALLLSDLSARMFGLYFFALGAFCVFRFFRYGVVYKAQYKKLAELSGGDNWMRTIDFTDDGIITTNGSIIIKNTYDEITALRETGNKIVLDTNKTAVIRLYKDSFTLGSYEEFKSLIKEKTGLSL